MRQVTPDALLGTWEAGLADSRPGARARALLAVACPDRSQSECLELSVGERDARLLDLRVALFGETFAAAATCPGCGVDLELKFRAVEVRSGSVPVRPQEVFERDCGRHSLRFRAPSVADLERIEQADSLEERYSRLLAAVILDARIDGHPCGTTDLPPAVLGYIESTLEELEVQVLMDVGVSCAACGHAWAAPFDVASYLWTELERWAVRTLWEVHALARAYAWTESVVIQMSPWRRQRYLEMLGT